MTEFAIIKTGGKQYRVWPGYTLKIEKIKGDFKVGDSIVFDQVLLTEKDGVTNVGAPLVSGAKVNATFEEAGRNKKINVIKYLQKSRYFKKNGHKQPYFKVKIEKIAHS